MTGLMAVAVTLAITSSPAVSSDMRTVDAGVQQRCETATWPKIPRHCLTSEDGHPAREFTYARSRFAG